MTSHAVSVARGMGRPAASPGPARSISTPGPEMRARGKTFRAGDVITIDGSTGEVLSGLVKMIEPS